MNSPNISQPSSYETLPSSPASRSSSIRSSSSSCSEVSESTYRELQMENHTLRKRLRTDNQRFAIVLEQFREDERAVKRMQQKVEELQASLEAANSRFIDVLDENHELRRSIVDFRKSISRSATEPSSRSRRHSRQRREQRVERAANEPTVSKRETWFEETPEEAAEELPVLSATITAIPQQPFANDETPFPKPVSSYFDLQQYREAPRKPSNPPLSPLSFNEAPAHRRSAISASQDSFLARSLQTLSMQMAQPATPTRSQRRDKPTSKRSESRLRAAAITPHPSSNNLHDSLHSAKRLPHPQSPPQDFTSWASTAQAVSAAC